MPGAHERAFSILRIVFGLVWAVDAYFKWQPSFLNNFTNYLTMGADGQPPLVRGWINLWIHGVSVDPHFFGIVVALAETAIAIGLLFGLFTKVAMAGGIAMTLVIWSTAEGFGGPYVAGSTDIGAAIIYVLVFIALWLGTSWRRLSIDAWLRERHAFFLGEW
ncbi:MAG: DoxX family protein [Patescibacteria group bacterium]|nr:DoxX family protein [Patescibacteria group bacterium]